MEKYLLLWQVRITTLNIAEKFSFFFVFKKGRQFYKCPLPEGGCDFFLWTDSVTPSGHMTHHMTFSAPRGGQIARQPRGLSLPGASSQQQNWGASKSDDPMFGDGASSRKVRASSRMGGARNKGVTVVCNCGNEAVLRIVMKEGPNKGKQFYGCSKPQEEQCRFFEWRVPTTTF